MIDKIDVALNESGPIIGRLLGSLCISQKSLSFTHPDAVEETKRPQITIVKADHCAKSV